MATERSKMNPEEKEVVGYVWEDEGRLVAQFLLPGIKENLDVVMYVTDLFCSGIPYWVGEMISLLWSLDRWK
jgi:hypothetical protein